MSDLLAAFNQSTTGGTILVVDDEPINIQIIYQILGNEYQILMATNAAQALSVCKASMPDLVLLDVMMPDIDGWQICQQMKADAEIAAIPVVFITGMQHQANEDACWNAGAVDFIQKPVNPSTLRHRVNNHITQKRQSDLLKSLAYVDGLTEVYNRRYFDDVLKQQLALKNRNGGELALLLVDVDHFKAYNDSQGHLAGDDALRKISLALKTCCHRPTDVVARYGGEEFAIILPNTNQQGAVQVAAMILKTIAQLNIPHPHSTMPYVTVSIGIAIASNHTMQTLIAEADDKLYQAKNSGRNQYIS